MSLIPSTSYIIVERALSGSPNVFYPLHPPWFLGLLSCIFPSLHTGVMGLVAAWWRICVNWVLLEINWKRTTSHKYIYIDIYRHLKYHDFSWLWIDLTFYFLGVTLDGTMWNTINIAHAWLNRTLHPHVYPFGTFPLHTLVVLVSHTSLAGQMFYCLTCIYIWMEFWLSQHFIQATFTRLNINSYIYIYMQNIYI